MSRLFVRHHRHHPKQGPEIHLPTFSDAYAECNKDPCDGIILVEGFEWRFGCWFKTSQRQIVLSFACYIENCDKGANCRWEGVFGEQMPTGEFVKLYCYNIVQPANTQESQLQESPTGIWRRNSFPPECEDRKVSRLSNIFKMTTLFSFLSPVEDWNVVTNHSRIYDPLGLIGPIITKGKIFMQLLWKLRLYYNESIPQSYSSWIDYRRFTFPRSVCVPSQFRDTAACPGSLSCMHIRSSWVGWCH